ncbi:hypothetical protein ACFO5Q_14500 [Kordiimonas lipolytica]|uniref:Uncharacterized protein n=1 Tax=Kordiimonas lipolytica TaxID=1662421 RepID=A0ABV8UEE2_9PROT|nr:hypothetical protein [Kordiimonas lipolytica]
MFPKIARKANIGNKISFSRPNSTQVFQKQHFLTFLGHNEEKHPFSDLFIPKAGLLSVFVGIECIRCASGRLAAKN